MTYEQLTRFADKHEQRAAFHGACALWWRERAAEKANRAEDDERNREPCGCDGTPHYLTAKCPRPTIDLG